MNTVPAQVRITLIRHLETLRGIAETLERGRTCDQKFGGGGRYESEILTSIIMEDSEGFGGVLIALEMVKEFRTHAPKNGVDANAFLASVGGVPNLRPSDKALAYLTDGGRPLPVVIQQFLKEIA